MKFLNENNRISATFSDITIIPGFSTVERDEIDTSVVLNGIKFEIPIINSPMDTVSWEGMISALNKSGGCGSIHRYQSAKDMIKAFVDSNIDDINRVAVSIGTVDSHKESIDALIDFGFTFFILDVAHGGARKAIDTIHYLRSQNKNFFIVSGSICDRENAEAAFAAGANAIRVGVSPGSCCSTRQEIGVGLPLIESLIDIKEYFNKMKFDCMLIGDGGIRQKSDFIKAIACGADAVIIGTELGLCNESHPKFKEHGVIRGMASVEALTEGNNKKIENIVAEGVCVRLRPNNLSVGEFVKEYKNNLKTAMFYIGAKNIKEIHEKVKLKYL